MIGCVGGGSNFAGLAFPFLRHRLQGKPLRFIAAEPKACPTMSRGQYRYDFGDTTKLTPLIKMYTLGHSFVPPGIHAGGLRYHGMAPMVSLGAKLGLIEPISFHQIECFEAARLFAQTEGMIPAPETSHAIRAAIIEAIRCRETGQEECILFNFSGHGTVRPGQLRQVPQRQARRLRVPAGTHRRGHRGAAGDRVGRVRGCRRFSN